MMMPNYIREGTFAGSGFFYTGQKEPTQTPFECFVEIAINRESTLISGYYQFPSTIDRRRFSASLSNRKVGFTSLTMPTLATFDISDTTLGESSGILSSSGPSMLVQACS